MGYDKPYIIAGRDPTGNAICGGVRGLINLRRGRTLDSATFYLCPVRMYPGGIAIYDTFTDVNGTPLEDHQPDLEVTADWLEGHTHTEMTIQGNQVYVNGIQWSWSPTGTTLAVDAEKNDTEIIVGDGGAIVAGREGRYWRIQVGITRLYVHGVVGNTVAVTKLPRDIAAGAPISCYAEYSQFYTCSGGDFDGKVYARVTDHVKGDDEGIAGIVFWASGSEYYWVFAVGGDPSGYWLFNHRSDDGYIVGDFHADGAPSGDLMLILEAYGAGNQRTGWVRGYASGELIVSAYAEIYIDPISEEETTTVYGTKVGLFRDYDVQGHCRYDNFEFIRSGVPNPNLEIACDDVDDSDDFSVSLPGTRALTAAKEPLGNISGWSEGGYYGVLLLGPAQEIISRPGWAKGRHMSAILCPTPSCANGERIRFRSYDGGAPLPKIVLSWREE